MYTTIHVKTIETFINEGFWIERAVLCVLSMKTDK